MLVDTGREDDEAEDTREYGYEGNGLFTIVKCEFIQNAHECSCWTDNGDIGAAEDTSDGCCVDCCNQSHHWTGLLGHGECW